MPSVQFLPIYLSNREKMRNFEVFSRFRLGIIIIFVFYQFFDFNHPPQKCQS